MQTVDGARGSCLQVSNSKHFNKLYLIEPNFTFGIFQVPLSKIPPKFVTLGIEHFNIREGKLLQ